MVNKAERNDPEEDDDASDTLETLVDMNHPALQDILAEVIHHPARRLRTAAAYHLAEFFQDVRAVPTLVEALNGSDRASQKKAAEALWDIGDANSAGLVDLLDHTYGPLRDQIIDALDQIGWQADDVHSDARFRIVARQWVECIALGEAAVEPLIDTLRSDDSAARRAAAWALGQIASSRAVPGLVNLLNDVDGGMFGVGSRVCDVAAEALIRIGTPEALDAVELWQRS
jgi:HEAT repeat protein